MNDAIREKLRNLPDKPGCYMMRDRSGRIIYVGKAVSLRKRVRSYFRPATMRKGEPKLRSLVNSANDLDWIVLRSEDDALLAENELIKQHQPKYNVLLKDDKRYLGIRADATKPLARLEPCRLFRNDGAEYFGPFPKEGGYIRPVIDYLERTFGLRSCHAARPDAQTYAHCNDDIIRTCSAPCVGKTSEAEYQRHFQEACACLRGERPELIEDVKSKMNEAAEALNFEAAAKLRDAYFGLLEMAKKRRKGVVTTPEIKKEHALRGLSVLKDALGLDGLPRLIECFDISNTAGMLAVASMVVAVDGVPDHRRYRRFRIRDFNGPDDPGMIAQAVWRRYARLRDEERQMPDLVILDGGITQLRAARRALKDLGLADIPTVGLAKQFEELVTDNGKPPVLLPRDSLGLMVVTRLRDEAHRFGINSHRRLRDRAIRESVLDTIPGIGPVKKMALLKIFGSVRRLAQADKESVAACPGIGMALAETVLEALKKE